LNAIFAYSDSILLRRKPRLVGLGRPEVTPVEQALVDDRGPNGLPKKPFCDEAGSSTEKLSSPRYLVLRD